MLKKEEEKERERKTNKQEQPKYISYKENTGTKLITNTKKHKLKIQNRVWNFRYTMLFKRRNREKEKEKRKKGHRNYIKKNYRYKIDNIYQKVKIKNLEQSLKFQKYNVKKKEEEK